MASKKQLQDRIDALEAELAREQRASGALLEWFHCKSNGHAWSELDVSIDGAPALTVHVHGITRASGGVVVVHTSAMDYHDPPRYLDDLCREWAADRVPEIRAAAALLLRRRDEYTNYGVSS